ncbi:hypothetical protein DVS77_29630 [Mycolicibacterium moriokaense]|nr:hypothetical protein DVS77_29630 [Mycolicibacterium moriokaense]
MIKRRVVVAAMAVVAITAPTACADKVSGTSTWPGATLEDVVLTADDFPPGVQYGRVVEDPGAPDGTGGPPPMLSKPEGCSDALTSVIAASAERGPGSAAKYNVAYDGARIVMTVLTWNLDLAKLAATAERCAQYQTFFDPTSPGIPMTTTRVPSPRPDALVYRQTMDLNGAKSSVIFSFENVHKMAAFGIAFPTPNPMIPVKAALPQTFMTIVGKQAERLQDA